MDATDSRIVELLRADARAPLKTIAGKVGLARSTVRDRITRLEEAGVIRAYRAEIAPGAEAPLSALLDVQACAEADEALLAMIRALPELRRCYVMAEPGRLLVEIAARDVAGLYAAGDWIAQRPEIDSVRVSLVRGCEGL